MADDFEYDFFISRTGKDSAIALRIAAVLESEGLRFLLQDVDFVPTTEIVERMEAGMNRARCTISVLSPEYFDSPYTKSELRAAFDRDPDGTKGTLVLIRAREFEIPYPYKSRVWIDFVDVDEAAERTLLLRLIGKLRDRGVLAVPVPPASGFAISNLPQRNENFTGRRELLERLHSALHAEGAAAVTQAVHGLGGVGKTQLALEYAHAFGNEYDLRWWIESETQPETGFAALAPRLGLEFPEGTDQRIVVAAVRDWLESHDRWLLVFDNVEQPEAIAELRPRSGGGHVVVTSRHSDWFGHAGSLPVGTWDRDESLAFLEKATGRDEPDAADALAAELGDLPLALVQASGYVRTTGIGLADYLARYRERGAALWQKQSPPADYQQRTIATTWDLSREQLKDAVDLLRLCSFFDPDGIPRSLLAAAPDALPKKLAEIVTDDLAFDAAVAQLRRLSLVDFADGDLTMHRVLQVVVRDGIRKQDRAKWVERAAETVAGLVTYEVNRVETWEPSAAVLPHALALADAADQVAAPSERVGWALDRIATGHWRLGRYRLAREGLLRALEVTETVFGKDHEEVAVRCSNLGVIEKDLGNLEEAKRLLERAVEIDEQAYGADHPRLAIRYSNLALVEQELGNLGEAKRLLEWSIEIGEEAFEADHPALAIRYSNLALVEQDLGNLGEAKRLLERAVEILEQAFEADHPHLARSYFNLGQVEKRLGHVKEARRLFEAAIAIDSKVLGLDHPSVAIRYHDLALLQWGLGEESQARERMRGAYDIWLKRLGAEHRWTKLAASWLRKHDPEFEH